MKGEREEPAERALPTSHRGGGEFYRRLAGTDPSRFLGGRFLCRYGPQGKLAEVPHASATSMRRPAAEKRYFFMCSSLIAVLAAGPGAIGSNGTQGVNIESSRELTGSRQSRGSRGDFRAHDNA